MKKLFFLFLTIACMQLEAQEKDAAWIWNPGDFDIWLSNNVQVLRTERGMFYPPFWRLDSHAPLVTFDKTVDLQQEEIIEVAVEGNYNVTIDGHFVYEKNEQLTIPAGKHSIRFKVYNPTTPPSIWVKGKTVVSDKTWIVSRQNHKQSNADSWIFNRKEHKPSGYKLAITEQKAVNVKKETQSVLVDYGKETFGFFKLYQLKGNGKITAWYGESEEEAMSGKECETWDVFDINQPMVKDYTARYSRAFRYIRFTWTGDINFDDVSMLYEYNPLEYKGEFRCSDDEINRIWDVAAYTLHLSSREFFLDGIKRDRWLWSGDAYQSYLMNYYLFADNPLVKRTTWALRGNDPVETHINTILDYSFYWFMGIYDYYLYTGDKEFVQQIWPKMLTLMDFCLNRRNANGMVEGLPGDWVFVDWAPISKDGEMSVEQILLCRSLETMALCANLMNDSEKAGKYQKLADELRENIMHTFWDPMQKALVHSRENGKLNTKVTKYGNMFAMIFDYLTEQQKEEVKNSVFLNDKILKITTPYMRFYELEAMCRIKQHNYVLGEIKSYWGGMLKLGATSFWEAYDPTQSESEHYAMYDRPYGKSLCHAWGASPIYLFGKYYLGVSPTSPGFETYVVEPELGGLKWMKGSVPTPNGDIKLHVTEKQITIETLGGRGVLKVKSKRTPVCKSAKITNPTSGYYEIELEPNGKYEVKL